MADPVLVRYLKENITKGYSAQVLSETLVGQGYPAQDVADALSEANAPALPAEGVPPAEEKVSEKVSGEQSLAPPDRHDSYFLKLSGILFHPLNVLEGFKSEKGIKKPFMFFLFSSLIAAGIIFAFTSVAEGVLTALFATILLIILNVLLLFVASGIFHLIIRLVGGKNPFYQTFKAYAYMSGFWILSAFIRELAAFFPLIVMLNLVVSVWVLILWSSCLSHYTDLSNGRIALAIVIGVLLVVGLAFLFVSFGVGYTATMFSGDPCAEDNTKPGCPGFDYESYGTSYDELSEGSSSGGDTLSADMSYETDTYSDEEYVDDYYDDGYYDEDYADDTYDDYYSDDYYSDDVYNDSNYLDQYPGLSEEELAAYTAQEYASGMCFDSYTESYIAKEPYDDDYYCPDDYGGYFEQKNPYMLNNFTFDDPKKTIEILEQEMLKGNVKLYIDQTYISPYLEQAMMEQYYMTVSDLDANTKYTLWNTIPDNLSDGLKYYVNDWKFSRIDFTNETVFNDTMVRLDYTVYIVLEEGGEEIAFAPSMIYMTLMDSEWFIDLEAEFKNSGKIV